MRFRHRHADSGRRAREGRRKSDSRASLSCFADDVISPFKTGAANSSRAVPIPQQLARALDDDRLAAHRYRASRQARRRLGPRVVMPLGTPHASPRLHFTMFIYRHHHGASSSDGSIFRSQQLRRLRPPPRHFSQLPRSRPHASGPARATCPLIAQAILSRRLKRAF